MSRTRALTPSATFGVTVRVIICVAGFHQKRNVGVETRHLSRGGRPRQTSVRIQFICLGALIAGKSTS